MTVYEIIGIIGLSVSLAADAFAVSVGKGLAMGKIRFHRALIVGIWFGTFQALMPTIGYFVGSAVGRFIGDWGFTVSSTILAVIGVKMIIDAIRGSEEKQDGGLAVKEMLFLSVATSIDALAAGVSMALDEVNVVIAITMIGVITLALSTGGVYVGGFFGSKFEKPARIAGGAVLVLLAIKSLVVGLIGIL